MIPKYYFGKFYMHISLSCGKNPLAILSLGITSASCLASQTDIVGPPDSVAFGAQIAALPNGNIVVTDPYHPAGGAVYLYSRSGALLSTLTGGNNTQASGLTAITITVEPISKSKGSTMHL